MTGSAALLYIYCRVDTNKSGTITGAELQSALSNGNSTEFNIHTVNMMIGQQRLTRWLAIRRGYRNSLRGMRNFENGKIKGKLLISF